MKFKIVCILFLLASCTDWDTSLKIDNTSIKPIRYYFEVMDLSDSIPKITLCEKTVLYNIPPHGQEVLRTQNKWSLSLKGHSEKVLRIFIVDEDLLMKYGTCKIFTQQIFKKRIDLSYNDLERINWRVVYRPEKY